MTEYQTIRLKPLEGFFNHLYRSFASKACFIVPVFLMQIILSLKEVTALMANSDTLLLNFKEKTKNLTMDI
ncbi:hypothetical protein [Pedobacter rhodius]|uniref:ABC transporter permease n=1 Tax=Pedobacter rhodius TaxID=3004098 RepID=A0ABT4KW48_9SPHI|nr:hypothetical protein [Pedobacter sp. SJ11]MCZ4222976.1 hypothetical protein [Pedobacter sp. SJ11]